MIYADHPTWFAYTTKDLVLSAVQELRTRQFGVAVFRNCLTSVKQGDKRVSFMQWAGKNH